MGVGEGWYGGRRRMVWGWEKGGMGVREGWYGGRRRVVWG